MKRPHGFAPATAFAMARLMALAMALSQVLTACSSAPRKPAAEGITKPDDCGANCARAGAAGSGLLQQIKVDRALFDLAERPPFVPRRGRGAFSNYVAVALPTEPAAELKAAVEAQFGEELRWRSESHLTAITPPEFHDVLASRLRIEDLEQIAEQTGLQRAPIEPICVGRAEALVEGARHRSYFLVVRSEEALRFRRAVAEAFERRGGPKDAFRAERWYPHVTIGFTKRDLHEEDGALKDERLCAARLAL